MTRAIAQVIDYGGPTGGSFMPAIQSLSRALIRRGERSLVFATRVSGATWPADLVAAGAEVHLVDGAGEVVEGLRRFGPSVVHSHFTRFDFATLQARRNRRVFWHIHSHREDRSMRARLKALVKYRVLARQVEALVPVSNTLADECVQFFAPRRLIRVVQNGIDTTRFRPPSSDERSAARSAYGINDDDRIILFFERVPYKGGATLRSAMRRLPGYRVLVAGGTQADRERFGHAPNVIAVARAADARSLYWAADMLGFASDNEAFGFVLAEAMACGLPIAATAIPIVHEICGSSNQIALFPVRDGDAMAAALQKLTNPQVWDGRERIVKQFALERWTNDMLRLYDSA